MRVYFFERFHGGPKSKDFWPTIKPFLSKKRSNDDPTIILNEEEKIISDQKDVCHIFKDFFINVVKDIGSNNGSSFETHPSILKIHEQSDQCTEPFRFEQIDSTYVHKSISNFKLRRLQELMAYLPRSLNPVLNL